MPWPLTSRTPPALSMDASKPAKNTTYPEELAQAGIVRFARFSLGIFQILAEPKADDFEHAVEWFVRGSNSDKRIWSVKVGPVFEIGGWLQQL